MSDDHKHRAHIFLHRGQLTQARAAYEQAVADDRLAHDHRALSDSLGNLGNVCALSDDLNHAEACYREVLTIQRTERNQQAIAHTLVNLGNLHIGANHPEKARPYYLERLGRTNWIFAPRPREYTSFVGNESLSPAPISRPTRPLPPDSQALPPPMPPRKQGSAPGRRFRP